LRKKKKGFGQKNKGPIGTERFHERGTVGRRRKGRDRATLGARPSLKRRKKGARALGKKKGGEHPRRLRSGEKIEYAQGGEWGGRIIGSEVFTFKRSFKHKEKRLGPEAQQQSAQPGGEGEDPPLRGKGWPKETNPQGRNSVRERRKGRVDSGVVIQRRKMIVKKEKEHTPHSKAGGETSRTGVTRKKANCRHGVGGGHAEIRGRKGRKNILLVRRGI